jgi:beta-phosphoglucomutase
LDTGIIFDLDGVLTDTVEFHYRSWQRLADDLGVPFSRERNEALRGRSRGDALRLLLGDWDVVDGGRPGDSGPDGSATGARDTTERLLELKNRYFLEQIERIDPSCLIPGARGLLEEARRRGAGLGLASSSRNARLVCERLGILGLFGAFADGNTGLRPKPAPDLFLWVAGRLGLPPATCVVVEDAEAGVEAGLAGGFRVVGVGPVSRVARAHARVAALEDLSLDDLISRPDGAALPVRSSTMAGSRDGD